MAKKFKGTIELDIRNSVEDWDAFTQPSPPKGSPNVIILLWDDTGFATWDIFGGLVKVPNMKRLAEKGVRYTQFHTTALCSLFIDMIGRPMTPASVAGVHRRGRRRDRRQDRRQRRRYGY